MSSTCRPPVEAMRIEETGKIASIILKAMAIAVKFEIGALDQLFAKNTWIEKQQVLVRTKRRME